MADDDLDQTAEADRRFAARLAETGARDPREHYRTLLKELKEEAPEGFAELSERYRSEVVPRSADPEHDPLEIWLEYGLDLAEARATGRSVEIDASGRAGPVSRPARWSTLILHLPDEKRARAIPVSIPPEPTPAQKATVDLLVQGRVKPVESP